MSTLVKEVRKELKDLDDKGLEFLWNEILRTTLNVSRKVNKRRGLVCFLTMVEINPDIQKLDSVMELCSVIRQKKERNKIANINRGKLKRARLQNENIDSCERAYAEEVSSNLNTSIQKLKDKNKGL